MTDADLIRSIRYQRGWSVREMADALGVSPRTVEGWEQGRKIPRYIQILLVHLTGGTD